jgi:ATP-dependent Clp protease adaptor protein ClpS
MATGVAKLRVTSTQTDGATATLVERPWNVVVWNDPVTPMAVVTKIFQKVFGYPESKAKSLMMTVHHEGRAIVWSGPLERAQQYCVKLQVAGLQSTVEQAD